MKLQEKILDACRDESFQILAARLGYSNQLKGAKRIERVVHDVHLGLTDGDWDGVFGSSEFIRKLVKILSIEGSSREVENEIRLIEDKVHEHLFGYAPWIFVETHFKRTTESILTLAALEGRRRIPLQKSLLGGSDEVLVEKLKSIISQHYKSLDSDKNNCKILEVWGVVDHYDCHIAKDRTFRISPEGSVLAVIEGEIKHSLAVMSL